MTNHNQVSQRQPVAAQLNHADLKRFYTLPEVSQVTGISTSHIRKMANDGEFPRQVKLGRQKVAWVIEEVNQWINERLAERGECA